MQITNIWRVFNNWPISGGGAGEHPILVKRHRKCPGFTSAKLQTYPPLPVLISEQSLIQVI